MKYSIIIFICLAFQISTLAQDSLSPDKTIEQLMAGNKIAGITAAYSIEGKMEWEKSMGFSNVKEQILMSPKTKTRLASIAKSMTAIAVMQLVESGQLNLDEPIDKYIPTFPHQSKTPITTRHLLAHTSGMDAYQSPKEAENKKEYANLSEVLQTVQDRPLRFEPGTDFYYTTYGYVVLGIIIENISGLTYESYMQKNIWEKAGMQNTGIEKFGKSYANKSLLYHKKRKKAKLAKINNLSNRIPGGGFYATLEDVLIFGNAVLNHSLINEASFQELTQVSSRFKEGNPYGFGWFLYGEKGAEHTVIGHGGAQTGCNTQLFIVPDTKTVVVLLSNTSGNGNKLVISAVDILKHIIELTKERKAK